MQFHSVDFLHTYGRFLESFFVAQYNPLVRFGLACRSDARHSDNWPVLKNIPALEGLLACEAELFV